MQELLRQRQQQRASVAALVRASETSTSANAVENPSKSARSGLVQHGVTKSRRPVGKLMYDRRHADAATVGSAGGQRFTMLKRHRVRDAVVRLPTCFTSVFSTVWPPQIPAVIAFVALDLNCRRPHIYKSSVERSVPRSKCKEAFASTKHAEPLHSGEPTTGPGVFRRLFVGRTHGAWQSRDHARQFVAITPQRAISNLCLSFSLF